MEKRYWLGRQRASLNLAQGAAGAEARLVYYDMAGRYGMKALSAGILANARVAALRPPIQDCKDQLTATNASDA